MGDAELIITWSTLDNNSMDSRMFLGYKLYYRVAPVGEIGKLSIFDDNWQMQLVDPTELYGTIIAHLKHNTWYALYIQTLMINSPEVKGGISDIVYAKTLFGAPSAVRNVQITPGANSISISWMPPIDKKDTTSYYKIECKPIPEEMPIFNNYCNLKAEAFDIFDTVNKDENNDFGNKYTDIPPYGLMIFLNTIIELQFR